MANLRPVIYILGRGAGNYKKVVTASSGAAAERAYCAVELTPVGKLLFGLNLKPGDELAFLTIDRESGKFTAIIDHAGALTGSPRTKIDGIIAVQYLTWGEFRVAFKELVSGTVWKATVCAPTFDDIRFYLERELPDRMLESLAEPPKFAILEADWVRYDSGLQYPSQS